MPPVTGCYRTVGIGGPRRACARLAGVPDQPSTSTRTTSDDAAVSAPPARHDRPPTTGARPLVLGACAILVAAHLALRAWALYPSWFYLDDLQMLDDAERSGLGAGLLLEPYDSQFMPLGRFLAWVVTTGGDVDWALAATTTLLLHLLAAAACVWMLVVLFGARWAVVPLLALYLSSAMTLPAAMWWAASLNALPLQVAFFSSVAAWTCYLRTGRLRWLLVTLVALSFGLLGYVKALVLLPMLAAYALGWFAEGGPARRARVLARRFWPALVGCTALAVAYLVHYLLRVPSLAEETSGSVAGGLAETMLGRSLSTGLLGGPWRWSDVNPPAGLADPPDLLVHLAWVALALGGLFVVLRRTGAARAWTLLAAYAAASYVLLLVTRAPVVGEVAGLEYRYLSDVACAAVLCLGLAVLPLAGAPGSSRPRDTPLLLVGVGPRVLTVATAVVVVAGVVSSVLYARIWHTDNPGETYLRTTQAEFAGLGAVDVADTVVPDEVVPGYLYPFNTTVRLLPVVVDNARFPSVTDRLVALDAQGRPRRAVIDPVAVAEEGPRPGCGWAVREGRSRTVPLDDTAFDYTWWVRVGYLSSAADTVTVEVGDRTVEMPVDAGLGSLYVEVTSAVSSVTLDGLSPGTTMCVDVVEVGTAVAGGPL